MSRREEIKNAAKEEKRSIANSTDYVDSAAYDGLIGTLFCVALGSSKK